MVCCFRSYVIVGVSFDGVYLAPRVLFRLAH